MMYFQTELPNPTVYFCRFEVYKLASMAKNRTLNVNQSDITVIHQNETDHISLTDMTVFLKEAKVGLRQKWITNKNTLKTFLSLGENQQPKF